MLADRGIAYYEHAKLLLAMGWSTCDSSFLIGTLQQTLEFLLKAIAIRNVPGFVPKVSQHETLGIIRRHARTVPIFATLAEDRDANILLRELTKGYLKIRYGEAHLAIQEPTLTRTFCRIAEALIATTGRQLHPPQYRFPGKFVLPNDPPKSS
jgi:hypothetical protein